MKNKIMKFGVVLFFLVVAIASYGRQEQATVNLKVNFISNMGSDPIFSWKIHSGETGFIQRAFELAVSDARNGEILWDSGKVETSNSLQFRYSGPVLKSGQPFFAMVRVWDQQGKELPLSELVHFIVPLKYPDDWKGVEWLTYDYDPAAPLPLFRKTFKISDPEEIKYARLYIAAPGYYEAFLNGRKIGKNVLDPGQTNYEDYTYYTVYDIDPSDLAGENVLGVMLGNGWWNQNQVWHSGKGLVYGQPVFICQLVIHKKDGTPQTVASDESWKWISGPITYSNIYGGEHYDARLENTSKDWKAVSLSEVHPTRLFEQFAEPIRVMKEIEPVEVFDQGIGTNIFDMGQNMAGWLRLKVRGEKGQKITLRCTEVLDEKGNIDPRSTGVEATKVVQTLEYICKGAGEEIWEPKFTYFGFRFVEVTGLKQPASKELLTGIVVHSSCPDAGVFQCSEENINRLHTLAQWTLIGNMHSIPTDCPHREKCGWTGDAHALVRAAIYNYDVQRFFEKYMFDMRSSARVVKRETYFGADFHDRSIVMKPKGIPTMIVPGKRTSGIASPDWGTAMVQIPWYLYLYYGDRLMLEEFYSDMAVWVDYIQGIQEDGIIPHGLGDWCPIGGNRPKACPVPVSSSAFHILDVSIMAKVSALLGKVDDHTRYTAMLGQLKEDFNRHFLDLENHTYGSQTADALALDIGIVPPEYRRQVAGAIVKNIHSRADQFLDTGIFGLARLFKVLAENGYEDEVYRLLTKTGRDSFAFMWEHFDVTTLWEVLPCDNDYRGSQYHSVSHNHPMQAGFDQWFYSGILGINPVEDRPGFQLIEFRPYLTRQLGSASGSCESGFGTISSHWTNRNGEFIWSIRIPANSRGRIWVPTVGSQAAVSLNGEPVKILREENGFSLIGEYGSGDYRIETTLTKQ